ncbi:MAG: radical SAM protein [Nitrospirae bacterium]|nr:radical SAM protein [Nitrospirota bacterium]MCL5421058.1 radical SAM protein [Nitrospirota bacterium]
MFDPVALAASTAEDVCRDDSRKYYRFRSSRFYGGISTADCVGCCLRCVFCWSWNVTTQPKESGQFYTAGEVAGRLIAMARRKQLKQLRISGNEPTICRGHLTKVLALIPKDYLFILETNGILIGSDPSYAEELSEFENIHVRVSLKGTCEEEFSRLTGAVPHGFNLQLQALEHLTKFGVRAHPSCMTSFSPPERISTLRKRLKGIHVRFEDFEIEELILYPSVEKRLRKMGIQYLTGHRPDSIPPEQV